MIALSVLLIKQLLITISVVVSCTVKYNETNLFLENETSEKGTHEKILVYSL